MIEAIVINLTSLTLCASSPKITRCYPIAVGRPGYETPVGNYQAIAIQSCPEFINFKSGRRIKGCSPANPLGRYFIGFKTDGRVIYGIHGTDDELSIGKRVSHGCIRMRNNDIWELYQGVTPITKIIVDNG